MIEMTGTGEIYGTFIDDCLEVLGEHPEIMLILLILLGTGFALGNPNRYR